MTVQRLDEETVILGDLDSFCTDLLQRIAVSADPSGHAGAEERLFSSPTHGAEPDMDSDWKEYVEPDLRRLFLDAVGVVQSDLEHLLPGEDASLKRLRLPVSNLEAWIHVLNQARLVLSARYGFGEEEMESEARPIGTARSLALFQVHFYSLLQEFFLRQLDEL